MEPRPYDLKSHAEFRRLLRELAGYMRVSLEDGTDYTGRLFALAALKELIAREEQGASVFVESGTYNPED